MSNKFALIPNVLDGQFNALDALLSSMDGMAAFGDVRISGIIAGDLTSLVARLKRVSQLALAITIPGVSTEGVYDTVKADHQRLLCSSHLRSLQHDFQTSCADLKALSKKPGLERYTPAAKTALPTVYKNYAVDNVLDWQFYQADAFLALVQGLLQLIPAAQNLLLSSYAEELTAKK